jgi:DNA repair protein RadC
MNVRLSKEQKIQIDQAEDIFKIMQEILFRENKIRRGQEHCWIIGLNTRSRILFIELVSLGGTNRVEVTPKEAFRIPIYKLATTMILIHNHPGGGIRPSVSDRKFTSRMIKAGELLGIRVIDHLIITETEFFSFAMNGLMDELEAEGWNIAEQSKKLLLNVTQWQKGYERRGLILRRFVRPRD